jgi:hypothetical protein
MAKQAGSFSTWKDEDHDADKREDGESPSPDPIDY